MGAAGLLSLAAEVESRPGAAELFEQQCAERLGGLGSPSAVVGWPAHAVSSSSSDEDDDEEEGRLRMEVDTSDPWAAAPAAVASAMDTNVWQSAPAADLSAERDWANFDAFSAPSGRRPSPPQQLPASAAALGEWSRWRGREGGRLFGE